MASISYEAIYSDFLGYVMDFSLVKFDTTTTTNMMKEWLHKSLAHPYIRRLFSTITLDDEIGLLNFELNTKVDEEADADFIRLITSKQMVVEWLEPHVKKTSLINQMFAGKEQKMFSQSQHLSEVRNLLKESKEEVRAIIRDRGYIYNPYLEETKNVEV